MVVETHVHRARDRVAAEREAVDAKNDAFEEFATRVEEIGRDQAATAGGGMVPATGTQFRDAAGNGGCRAVREAFADTVRPHSVADLEENEPLLESIRRELTDTLALALAPTTGTGLTDDLVAMIHAAVDKRRAETDALATALEREADQLAAAERTVDDVIDWIVDANERALPPMGFDELHERHRRLSSHRDRCARLARDRQAFLRGTTGTGEAGVNHRDLVGYCYADFPVEHPVLSTAVQLVDTCKECQRTVRAHLVRRG